MHINRLIILMLFLVAMPNYAIGQHLNKWRKANFSFETKSNIKKYFSWDRRIYDGDNDSLGINMELVKFKNESYEFINDIEYGCKEICEDMKMAFQSNGSSFLEGYKSHYIVCYDEDPVITAVILREDIQKAYEISIYCYEIDIDDGIKILKSIVFRK